LDIGALLPLPRIVISFFDTIAPDLVPPNARGEPPPEAGAQRTL